MKWLHRWNQQHLTFLESWVELPSSSLPYMPLPPLSMSGILSVPYQHTKSHGWHQQTSHYLFSNCFSDLFFFPTASVSGRHFPWQSIALEQLDFIAIFIQGKIAFAVEVFSCIWTIVVAVGTLWAITGSQARRVLRKCRAFEEGTKRKGNSLWVCS